MARPLRDDRRAMELYASRLAREVEAKCQTVETGHCLCGRALASGQVEFAGDLDERHEVRYPGIRSRPRELPVFMAPGQLEQLLLNLAANARDAMEGAGTLSIEVSEGATTGTPAAGIEGRYVAITVRDTGKGMADEVARKAFQAYFTTKAPDKGSGLGLAVVHGIVIEAGGTIEISSRPGEGAAFHIRLPRA